jgi:RecB family exonuclease
MSKLQIFSTARAIRKKLQEYKKSDDFLPKLMRIDEFEKSVATIPNLSLINPTQRVFYLKEASNFSGFEKLKSQRDLVRFFSQSDDFFKFFEELAWEMVEMKELLEADSYAEFGEHIEILSQLKSNYKKALAKDGFTDRMFIPKNYRLNLGFIESFDEFEIFIDGYLSRFELKLLQEVANHKKFFIHIRTTKYNQKMIQRFNEFGIKLPQNSKILFELSSKKIISSQKTPLKIDAKVYSLQNRFEQIASIFGEVEMMVRDGILPEEIAIIVPDEDFATNISIYDSFKNFNLAMGFKMTHTITYKKLKAISNYFKSFDNLEQLNFFKINVEKLSLISSSKYIDVESFFELLDSLDIEGVYSSKAEALESIAKNRTPNVAITYLNFHRLFQNLKLSFREWLYLWLKELENLRIDDVKGGKVTIMGLLETRGVDFRGVIICDFNEGLVPMISSKDRFLNSTVRKFAKLPTKEDRDSLQRHYYASVMERAKRVTILYATSNEAIASKFLYELNLPRPKEVKISLDALYPKAKKPLVIDDMEVTFDAKSMEWSATKLNIWLKCKRKFYYQYILKIEKKPSSDINAGAILHSSLKNIFTNYSHFLSKAQMREALRRDFERLPDNPSFNYHKKVWLKSMDRFFKQQVLHFKKGWRVLECEMGIKGQIDGINFVGKVDRIDRLENKSLLIDYKSTPINKVNPKSLDNLSDFQMNIYYLLLSKDFEIEDMVFWGLFDGDAISLIEAKRKEELLLSHIQELKSTTSFIAKRCDDIKKCRFCEYQIMCQRGSFI